MKISACMIEKKGGAFSPFFFSNNFVKDFTKNLDERLLVNFFTKKLDEFRLKNIFLDFF